MAAVGDVDDAKPGAPSARPRDVQRRRRLAQALDGALPQTTSDDVPSSAEDDPGSDDDWLRRQVPPHHG